MRTVENDTTERRTYDYDKKLHRPGSGDHRLHPSEDRILEIGAVKVVNGEITDRYETLVNPGMAISPRIPPGARKIVRVADIVPHRTYFLLRLQPCSCCLPAAGRSRSHLTGRRL